MASISSGFAAQQRMHQTARQRTASAPLVMRQSLASPTIPAFNLRSGRGSISPALRDASNPRKGQKSTLPN